ncbi:MAG: translation initiation factor IF-3 [Candidatus Wallbacteria bacterium]|nr:translation initiation factor IF-3 [Candidatus Wallbacteria bacterium]
MTSEKLKPPLHTLDLRFMGNSYQSITNGILTYRAALAARIFFPGGAAIAIKNFLRTPPPKANLPRVNEEIRTREVRVIGPEGDQFGILSIQDALRKADELNMDLVEIAPQSVPPVCKMMDFSKYRYELRRKERDARKKQKVVEIKQITMRLNIEDHDLKIKVKHAVEFLEDEDKVKFILRLRGREFGNKEKPRELFEKIVSLIGPAGKVEKEPDFNERQVVMIVTPQKLEKPVRKEEKNNAQDEN